MKTAHSLKIGIIGSGHFGRFHALKSQENKKETLIGLYDIEQKSSQKLAKDVCSKSFLTYEALLSEVEAVIIATPAESHFKLACEALEAGKHVLIEKPIASTLEQARVLISLAEQKRLVLQVGHLLRYSAEHNAIKQRIKKPLYIEATRIAPYKMRGTDVSVVLDLMIHDLDFILSLIDSEILTIDALGAAVSSTSEDIANARVRFKNGCVATITASRISFKTERKMRIFSQEGYLSADFMTRQLTYINRERGLMLPGTNGYKRESVTWRDHDNLLAEHEAFIASCLEGKPVIVDGYAGLRALEAALKVSENIAHSYQLMKESQLLSQP
ncbi:Gfo/Idh/MocA family oxidoreductase [Aristophania vespae]|uniref:Gfo/Idh/MocA family oxidoreductase n=1 Tax=Aristophania vespae TaxID=2697033 RepID=A0A6P1NDE6_9PROT|nr:Gfo/Idh/MocA family oxidoreductase [Aristophania vespae]QHI95538.1 Gfo/Idh/MocA family oxidoreductase [Aristophania vespae]UMM63194.1 Inositol 2-dehydrogenase/D-chiro-inositol 3-dehydrogenase [Aristophania vespae]